MKKEIKEEKVITPDFIMVPYQVFSDEKLSSTDKFVYGAVHFFASLSMRKCSASNKVLADFIRSTPSTVSNSLVLLEERGYISRLFFDDSHRKRKEIIPLAGKERLTKNNTTDTPIGVLKKVKNSTESEQSDTPIGVLKKVKKGIDLEQSNTPIGVSEQGQSNTPMDVSNTPIGVSNTPIGVLEVEHEKEVINIDNININDENGVKSDTPIGEEREKGSRITRKNNNLDFPVCPSGDTGINENSGKNSFDQFGKRTGEFTGKLKQAMKFDSLADIPHPMVADCIAMFLPVFPDLFVNKNQFAIPATQNAVKKVLMTVTVDELKFIIDKYLAGYTDKFRPDARNIYDFCTFKFERIKAYSTKSAGGLWAQKAISTPAQAKTREIQYQSEIEKGREKIRLAKEEWEKTHPKQ